MIGVACLRCRNVQKTISNCTLLQFRQTLTVTYNASRLLTTSSSSSETKQINSLKTTYDVVISGGGMVGTAAAAVLGSRQSFKHTQTLLLESSPRSIAPSLTKYSNRVSALSSGSVKLLNEVGAWQKIQAQRSHPVKQMHVWDSCSQSHISFDEADGQPIAHIVENDVITHALSSCVQNSSNVELAYQTSAKQYVMPELKGGLIKVELNTGETISTRLLIGADGFNSSVRSAANIGTYAKQYDQVGVVATLYMNTQKDDNVTAWQRFLVSGPIALLPLSSTTFSLVWSTSAAHAKDLLKMEPDAFVDSVNKVLWDKSLENNTVVSATNGMKGLLQSINITESAGRMPPTVTGVEEKSRAMFPYGMMHADMYVAPRLALIGDACHRIHPLAGQGVNLGFGDVACLMNKLESAVLLGTDIGWIDHLFEYETERQRRVVSIMAGIDGLSKLYSTSFGPVVLARSLGLTAVNSLKPVKDFFMREAQL